LLRSHRLKLGLTQEAVAERASLSVHAIQKLEHGTTHPYKDTTTRLVAALHLSAEDEVMFRELGQPAARRRDGKAATTPEFQLTIRELPVALTSFVGRERDLADVCSILVSQRLLTLTGVGGCGKTRLALEAARTTAREFADGACLVELATLRDSAQVPQSLGVALGVREVPTQPMEATLVSTLRSRRLLLILDNCEHLLDGCARLVDTLLSTCPGVHALATSREPLGLTGEVSWRVPSLPVPPTGPPPSPDAVGAYAASRLFVERAHAADPSFTVNARNAATIVRICHRLDGIPLALELAAVLVRGMSVDDLAERLGQRFSLLTGGSRVALPRQQTLRATIEWSYQLLSMAQRQLFACLSVFTGGWAVAAAEAVGAGDGIERDDVLGLLLELVEKSLVIAENSTDGTKRYTLLETLRQFAREQLVENAQAFATHQRHAEYYLMLAEQAEADGSEPEAATWTERLALEQSNFETALDWLMVQGNVDSAMRLAGVLWHLWQVRGYLREGRQRLASLLEMPGAAHLTLARARVVEGAGVLAMYQADAFHARRLFKECRVLYRQFGDEHRRAWVLIYLAWLAGDLAHPGAGLRFAEQAFELCERQGDRYGMSRALNLLGLLRWAAGDYESCLPLHQRSLDISRELGDVWGTAWALHRLNAAHLTLVSFGQAQVHRALSMIAEEGALWMQLGERRHFAFSLCNRGLAAAFDGRPADAHAALRQALAIFTDLEDDHGITVAVSECALVCSAEGRADQALRVGVAATALLSRRGIRKQQPKLWRQYMERLENAVRTSLGEAAVAAAWEVGRAMSLADVMACVEDNGNG
jgi:non-specific serine/threonine protein kinase